MKSNTKGIWAFLTVLTLIAMLSSGCLLPEGEDPWSASSDLTTNWFAKIGDDGRTSLLTWEEARSEGRAVISRLGEGGEVMRVAVATGPQLALDRDSKLASFSSLGLTEGTLPAGIVLVEMDSGATRRVTSDTPPTGLVPDDRQWPTLMFVSGGRLLWLSEVEILENRKTRYSIFMYSEATGPRKIESFAEISFMTLSPDRRVLGIAGTRRKEEKSSLFLLDLDTFETREVLHAKGVGWISFTANDAGYAVIGKAPRSTARSADAVIDNSLFSGGEIARWTVSDGSENLRIDLQGDLAESVHASPDGKFIAIVAWRRLEDRSSSSHLWLVESGSLSARDLAPTAKHAGGPLFSTTGKFLVHGVNSHLTRLDLQSNEEVRVLGQEGSAEHGTLPYYVWRKDDSLLFFGTADQKIGTRLSLWRFDADQRLSLLATRPETWMSAPK